MSIHSTRERDIDGALEPRIQVEEKEQHTVSDYPDDIVDQLKRAAFTEGEAANTYIKRVRPTNSSDEQKIATVEVHQDSLVIDVEQIVGIVNLTPNSCLQINPKIGWSDILEMFLAVGEQRRSLNYRGIPIREFLADDIGIEDVFIVVAVNYLNSLEDIFRHGLIRSFDRRRTTALDARGRIDIEASLQNFDYPNGVPQHEFVEKIVEYGIPVNDILCRAGKELERLFHLYAGKENEASYTRIFSRLEQAIHRLEQRGITGDSISLSEISEITPADLPRQRHYYAKALDISKTILSSSIGQPLDQGREELLMEYIIGMENLFEKYTELALNEELEKLQDNRLVSGLDSVKVEKQSYELFEENSNSYSVQPDHILKSNEGVVAVLDSKYYGRNKDPLSGNWSRSRLLSYGFRLETDNLGMIAPLAEPTKLSFKGRNGTLSIIAPNSNEFSTDGLRDAISEFLKNNIGSTKDTTLGKDLHEKQICYPEVEATTITEAASAGPLRVENLVNNTRPIFDYIVRDERLSDVLNPRNTQDRLKASRMFSTYLENEAEDWDIAIPIFVSANSDEAETIQNDEEVLEKDPELEDATEFVKIHCLRIDDGVVVDTHEPLPFGLKW